jgi:hypothetical protein
METKDSVAADAEEEDDGAADTIGKPALTLMIHMRALRCSLYDAVLYRIVLYARCMMLCCVVLYAGCTVSYHIVCSLYDAVLRCIVCWLYCIVSYCICSVYDAVLRCIVCWLYCIVSYCMLIV